VTFDRYTDEQWEAIVAACGDKRFKRSAVPVEVDWTKVRATLEENGRRFCHRRAGRAQVGVRELRSLRQKIRHIKALEAEPDLPQSIAWDLALWRQQLEDTEEQFDFYRSKGFRGRADLHREILYANILQVWKQLGGEPKFSRNDRGEGPCVRFMMTALGPILGPDTPKPEGFAGIIKRERDGSYKGMWFLDYGLRMTSDGLIEEFTSRDKF
jgi:hypothetical protein